MSVFGPFIQEVPARIGHNAALDAAVAVLVNVHTSLVYKKAADEIVSPELYIRAIKTLQSCLESPQLGMSPNTLCASVLLGLVEASDNASQPSQATSFDFSSNDELCKSLSDTPPSLDFSTDSFEETDFLEDLRPIKTSYPINASPYTYPYESARTTLLYKVYNLKDAVRSLGEHLNAKLTNGIAISETPAREKNSPMQTAYHFNNWRDMTAYNCFWSVVILTNKS
ncbi:unnamed protein product [Alternaria alternata]